LGWHSLGLACVLILERDTEYRDRVRGEGIFPWGVEEAELLGIRQPLLAQGGREVRWWAPE
jgi:hypothetical protein